MSLQLILCQVAIFLSVEFHTASCDTFYIVPTPDSHCPGEFIGVPCLTLQQYASNPSQSQNITFLVEPGIYNLSTVLTVSNGYNFTMSSTNATVVCTSSTAQFSFNRVENVHIRGMTFRGCSGTAVRMLSISNATVLNGLSTAQFAFSTVENVHISGMTFQGCRNRAITMSRITTAEIISSNFIDNQCQCDGGVI